MTRLRPSRSTALALLLVLVGARTQAQSIDPQRYVTVKGGANLERAEDDLEGTSAAGGAAIGVPISPNWLVELELWVPAVINYGSPSSARSHRDILVNTTVVRRFHIGRLRPFALGGIGLGRTQERLTYCSALRPRFGGAEIISTLVSCDEPDVAGHQEDRFDGYSLFGVVGAGTAIPMTNRIRLVTELRVNLLVGSIIARPAVGVQVAF